MKRLLFLILFSFFLISCSFAQKGTTTQHDTQMKWWREARFGMFIHWGLYSVPAGTWNEKTGYGEWIRTSAEIPLETYEQFMPRFNPVGFNADEWVKAARDAGMRYIVITSKHHDGFCMFDTKQTDFNIMKTPFKRDPMKELAVACEKYGLKFCFYYSIMDWHHPDYLPRREWEKDRTVGDADYNKYVAYMKAELKELLTQYGNIGVLWFDGEWEPTWNQTRGLDLYNYVKGLQPSILVNNRVGAGRLDMEGLTKQGMFGGDFGTPEQQIPPTGLPGTDWETCMTMNDHWGYNSNDKNFKSSKEIIRMLVDIASKGGNYLLNVGPTSLGTFPRESIDRLRDIGKWMELNSESVYGTNASPFVSTPWGRCTMKSVKGGFRLYLHVFNWPANSQLLVGGCLNKVNKAFILSDKNHPALKTVRVDDAIIISVPSAPPDSINTVVVLDFKGAPDFTDPPEISAAFSSLVDSLKITLSSPRPKVEIRFVVSDTVKQVDMGGVLYQGPFNLYNEYVVNARCFRDGKPVSGTSSRRFELKVPYAARAVSELKPGLSYRYFEGEWDNMPNFKKLQQWVFGTVDTLTLAPKKRNENFAMYFFGYIKVPKRTLYKFTLSSDDGSKLFIDDRLMINNDGLHSMLEKGMETGLNAGYHAIRVEYLQRTGSAGLELYIESPGVPKKLVTKEMLFHE
ncbi:MAG: alpha-L-fucosidase [Bacteroidetes bacterium]|nr:alpha-L-fucosidase [Bacteroidota bacterium]